jgi:hypothetical protein
MNPSFRLRPLPLLLLLSVLCVAFGVSAQTDVSREKFSTLWQRLDSLERKGLSRSARELTNAIRDKARAEEQPAELVKAIILRMKFVDYREEQALTKNLLELEDEIGVARFPEKPVLYSMKAELLWRYYQENRAAILDRGIFSGDTVRDPARWDVARFVKETHAAYQASLAEAAQEKRVQVNLFDPALIPGSTTEARRFRPSLYDFLAHRAIDFYKNEESELSRPLQGFSIGSAFYLNEADLFLNFFLKTEDTLSFDFQAIRLLQELLGFHQDDSHPGAFIDVDLERLAFVHERLTIPNKDTLYLKALRQIANRYRDFPGSADALYAIADWYASRACDRNAAVTDSCAGYRQRALVTCEEAIRRFPYSQGGLNAKALRASLLAPDLGFTLERTQLPARPILGSLNYRNVDTVWWKIVRLDDAFFEFLHHPDERLTDEKRVRRYLRQPVVDEGRWLLPGAEDLNNHRVETSLPALMLGRYAILISTTPGFSTQGQAVTYADFQVTRIALRIRRPEDAALELFVSEAETGRPLPGARIRLFTERYDYRKRLYSEDEIASGAAGQDGSFIVPKGEAGYATRLTVESGEDRLYTDGQTLYLHPQAPETRTMRRDVFFTDRSIYRPGQTIYFKVLLLESGTLASAIVPHSPITVRLIDPNNQTVDSLQLTSSPMGSVSGRFRIPEGRMTGPWRLQSGEQMGSASISVEEYKRPTFEVKLDPLRSTARPGDRLVVSGTAMAYTGVPIRGGAVRYRVYRTAVLPVWYYGPKRFLPLSAAQEVAHGTTATDDAGSFQFVFDATPDERLRAEERPEYSYRVDAEITDVAGETRSAQRDVSVAYVPLRIRLELPQQLDKHEIAPVPVSTVNLDGQRIGTNAVVRVWRLREPRPVVRERVWPAPDQFLMSRPDFEQRFPLDAYDDRNAPETWESQQQVLEKTFDTGLDSTLDLSSLRGNPTGWYRLECVAITAQRQEVRSVSHFLLIDAEGEQVPTPEPAWFHASPAKAEPGESVRLLFGSRLPEAHWLVEVERNGKITDRREVITHGLQTTFSETVRDSDRGNFTIHVSTTVGNRTYCFRHTVEVPHSDKRLDLQLETFRSVLEPGRKERWRIRLRNPDRSPANAELLANLYDASLDALLPHYWPGIVPGARPQTQAVRAFYAGTVQSNTVALRWYELPGGGWREYDRLNWFGYTGWRAIRYLVDGVKLQEVVVGSNAAEAPLPKGTSAAPAMMPAQPAEAKPDESSPVRPPIRANLQETAFFFPELRTDPNGDVLLEFDGPEALTKWKLMLFGHDAGCRTGYLEQTVVTQKPLMVMPNLPRFLRTGDKIDVPVRVDNLFDQQTNVTVQVELSLFDASTLQPVDDAFGNTSGTKTITVAAHGSGSVSFPITVPDRTASGPVVVRIRATANGNSDGEERLLPVLTDRILLTETKPFVVRGDSAQAVRFDAMEESRSATMNPVSLTLTYTADPIWYAVQALPYLNEYPYECAEQLFSRYYANAVSGFLLRSHPALERVFEQWRSAEPQALLSQLERNPSLKQIALEETPWLLAARDEGERKRNIALLFDLDRQRRESQSTLDRLRQSQNPDGSWSWFKGLQGDEYITRYILEGIGRLIDMQIVDLSSNAELEQMTRSGLRYLDDRFLEAAREREREPGHDTLPADIAEIHYLFVRSCFDEMPGQDVTAKLDDCYRRAGIRWYQLPLLSQSMLLRVATRRQDVPLQRDLVQSLTERSLYQREEGRWWKQDAPGFYWWSAPIETHANLIEAFREARVGRDTIDDLRTWLLRQKQTQDWKTTRATVQACFALLDVGTDWLSHPQAATLRIGNELLETGNGKGESGTGLIEKSWSGASVTPAHSRLEIQPEPGHAISWGSFFWQFTERMDAVRTSDAPFGLTKELYREQISDRGPELVRLADSATMLPGTRIVVRLILRADRDLEYVHLTDPRASGLEPEQVLSETVCQSGTCWYQSTRDVATHFFFPQMRKGVYVIEYPLRAAQSGDFACGPAKIQCLYAPEFTAHSTGTRLHIPSR